MRCTTFTLAPAEMASEAAVCRRACALIRGNVGSASGSAPPRPPATSVSPGGGGSRRSAAARSTRRGPYPRQVAANSSTTNPANSTVRALPDLSVPTATSPVSVTALRCSDPAPQEVDIAHPQRGHLTPAQTRGAQQQHQRVIPPGLGGERMQLRGGSGRRSALGDHRRQLHPAGRIGRQHAVFHRVAEDAASTECDICTITGPRRAPAR